MVSATMGRSLFFSLDMETVMEVTIASEGREKLNLDNFSIEVLLLLVTRWYH